MTKCFTDCLTEKGKANLKKIYAELADGSVLEGWEKDELLQFPPKLEDTEEIAKILTWKPRHYSKGVASDD